MWCVFFYHEKKNSNVMLWYVMDSTHSYRLLPGIFDVAPWLILYDAMVM